MSSRREMLLGASLALATLAGCIEREGRPVNPCTQVSLAQQIQIDNVDKVDLLFMIDNSGSMSHEQESLAVELPNMIRVLTSGDLNHDGDNDDPGDFRGVRDLHVGVITSDMGTGGHTVATCARSDFGDDGILRTQGNTADGCDATYPSILTYASDGGVSPEDFARDVACVSTLGTGGCGFEQQLEAILKALSPTQARPWTHADYVAPGTPGAPGGLDREFYRGSAPHGDRENDGFLREDSVLAIIPLTDEEDCSAQDPELFNAASPTYTGDLNLRCFNYGGTALHPISRYVEGFLQLRAREQLLVFAPIVGIPVDLAPQPGQVCDWGLLAAPDCEERDPRLCERIDPTTNTSLVPSCDVPGRGQAFPPLRIVRVAERLHARGAGVTVQSICQSSFQNALGEIIRLIGDALPSSCFPRPLNVEADGSVPCDVVVVMPSDRGCDVEGYTPKLDESGQPMLEDGRHVCSVTQLVPESRALGTEPPLGSGWYYDTFTSDGQTDCGTGEFQRIAFTGAQPPSGAIVRLECFLPVSGSTGDIGIGTFCDPDPAATPEENACSRAVVPAGDAPLACDPVQRLCGVRCEGDSDCRGAGLTGFVCDRRPLDEVDPDHFGGDVSPYGFCVNPTCG